MLTRKTVTISAVTALVVLVPLAAVRPSAQAQTPTPQSRQPVKPADWTVTLPTGVRVEITHVMRLRTLKAWRPDGTTVAVGQDWIASAHANDENVGNAQTDDSGTATYQIGLRVQGPVHEADIFDYRFSPASGAVYSPDWKKQGAAFVQNIYAEFPLTTQSVHFRYGLASGAWTTVATVGPGLGRIKTKGGSYVRFAATTTTTYRMKPVGGAIDLTNPSHNASLEVYPVAASDRRNYRIVAVTRSGKEIKLSDDTAHEGGKRPNVTADLTDWNGAPVKDVAQYRLEYRPCYWADFGRIALRPSSESSSIE